MIELIMFLSLNVTEVHNAIWDNLNYHTDNNSTQPLSQFIVTGKGDCTEFALLECEIYHRKGYDTKFVIGRVNNSNNSLLHAWCEYGNTTAWYVPEKEHWRSMIAHKAYDREELRYYFDLEVDESEQ